MTRVWFALLVVLAFAPAAWGQPKDYPNRPVKIVVMTTPGSSADQNARIIAEQFSASFGRSFIVENRPGGDGVTGAMAVKNAPADGYTILLGTNSPLSVNPVIKKDLPYDPLTDFRPVHGMIKAMNVLVAAGDSKFNTLADVIQAAKSDKRPLNVGTSFTGYRLDADWLASMAGVKFNQIPYKGTAQVLTDVIGHHLDLGFTDRAVANSLLQSGKLKGIVVGGDSRYPDPPDVPTAKESGYPEYRSFAWTALYVAAGTPDDIVNKLSDATQKAMASDAMNDFLRRMGADTLPLGPAAMRKFHVEEVARYRRVAEAAGIKPE